MAADEPVFRVLVERGRVYPDGRQDPQAERTVLIIDVDALGLLRERLSPEAVVVLQELVSAAVFDDAGRPVVECGAAGLAERIGGGQPRRGWSREIIGRRLAELAEAGLILERDQQPNRPGGGGFTRSRIVLNPTLRPCPNQPHRVARFRVVGEPDNGADLHRHGVGKPDSAGRPQFHGVGKPDSAAEQGQHVVGKPDNAAEQGRQGAPRGADDGVAETVAVHSDSGADQDKRQVAAPPMMVMDDEVHHHGRPPAEGVPGTGRPPSPHDDAALPPSLHDDAGAAGGAERDALIATARRWGMSDAERFVDRYGVEAVARAVADVTARGQEVRNRGAYLRRVVERALPAAPVPPPQVAGPAAEPTPGLLARWRDWQTDALQAQLAAAPSGAARVAEARRAADAELSSLGGLVDDGPLGRKLRDNVWRRMLAAALEAAGVTPDG